MGKDLTDRRIVTKMEAYGQEVEMANKNNKQQRRKRPLPKPPSPMPWFFVGSCVLVGGLYAIFQGWAWAGWVAIGLTPFIFAILPMEITDFLQRKRICEHIRRDFMDETSGSSHNDHSQFLSALHHDDHGARRIAPAFSPNVLPPWEQSPNDYPTASGHTR